MSKRDNVTDRDLEVAAAWLEMYEGDADGNDERDSCLRVVAMLRKIQSDRLVASVARRNGVPKALAREALKRLELESKK